MRVLYNNKKIGLLSYLHMIKRELCIAVAIILIICIFTACGTNAEKSQNDVSVLNSEEFPVTGHTLYGYKHDLMVYGQYMDQAGNNNAMVLIFVKKELDCSVDVNCKSILINGDQIEASITTETITPLLSVLQINMTSEITDIDQLSKNDEVALRLEIINTETNNIIEVTEPIRFPCN